MTAPSIDRSKITEPAERLIVALDVDAREKASEIVTQLDGLVSTYKVGMQLFGSAGPSFVEELVSRGKRVFLDLKFHDIPNTVARAGIEAARLGVWMFNVHASGGSEMMRAAFGEVSDYCFRTGNSRPLITAVTVLTSSDVNTLDETGVGAGVEEQVSRLARLAGTAGLDGVVASAREIGLIRKSVPNQDFCIVTPGIRPLNATNQDQKRVMSPGAAISAGADHLVIGRPIVDAADRAEAVVKILKEIGEAG